MVRAAMSLMCTIAARRLCTILHRGCTQEDNGLGKDVALKTVVS